MSPPGRSGSVGDRLTWQAGVDPRRPFLVRVGPGGQQTVLSYRDVWLESRAMARLLTQLGVRRGDTVHVQLGNVPELLVCLFAVAHLGAVLVPTHPSSTVDDVAYVMSHAGCRVSVTALDRMPVVAAAAEMVPELAQVVTVGGAADGAVCWEEVRPGLSEGELPDARPGPRDLLAVLYTSGSSGWPKGVMLTHGNLLFAGEAVAQLVRLRAEDRWLVTLPLSHANALLYSVMSAFVTGASAALVPAFDPARWAEQTRDVSATVASLFAVHVRAVLGASPGGVDTSGLRLTLFAQHLTEHERAVFEERFATRLVQVYGLTETLAPTLSDPVHGPAVPGTVGRPTPWVHTRLVDTDGVEVPPGRAGELLVQGVPGHSLMAGYLGREEDTRRILRDGWLATGDHLRALPDGSLEFLGRAEDVLKPGVDNVSAAEVERVLLEHVSVLDAAVVGVSTPEREEHIVGFVVLRPEDDATEAEVLAWAGDRLAAHKVPERVVAVPALPRNAVGKVLKRQLGTAHVPVPAAPRVPPAR
ncbi:class I adenylate-forming enzyme family protein [Geodermatophilus amargosae]|uniref:class I adenylate-forming enzyme family protein n=1 Tax=Geodermatophilus amargosae TaxID=1296565 RepID=UPI0034DEE527